MPTCGRPTPKACRSARRWRRSATGSRSAVARCRPHSSRCTSSRARGWTGEDWPTRWSRRSRACPASPRRSPAAPGTQAPRPWRGGATRCWPPPGWGCAPRGRRDALLAAAELAIALRERAIRIAGAVVTVGKLTIADAAANVIPGQVTISIDARCPTAEGLEQLIDGLGEACEQVAASSGCGVTLDPVWRSRPVPMSERVGDAIRHAAAAAGLELADLSSGGGHDAGILAEAGVDSGMLFVRSRNGGVSHRPEELTDEEDVATAIQLLAGTLATLSAAV